MADPLKIYMQNTCEPVQPELAALLLRFPRLHRRRVIDFATSDQVLADVLMAYPGFGFTLATDYGTQGDREAVIDLLLQGHSMTQLADTFGLPRWLRKLPPEAFGFNLGAFHQDAAFNRQLGNLLITDPRYAGRWLRWVMLGVELAGPEFALWLARQKVYGLDADLWQRPYTMRQALEPLALYAWYSQLNEGEPLRYMEKMWSGKIGLARAVAETRAWLERIKVNCAQDATGKVPPPWFPTWKRGGVEIRPLMRQTELNYEGEVMDHCVASYGAHVRSGMCCIYSLRKGRKTLATIELVRSGEDRHKAHMAQFMGYGNSEPSRAAKRYVKRWLKLVENEPVPEMAVSSSRRWRTFWRLYQRRNQGVVSPHLSSRWSQLNVFDPALDRLSKLAG